MYKKIILPLLMFLPLFAFGQTAITGKVTDAQNGAPLSAAKVTVIEQNISTQTNAQGQFSLSYLESGDVEISVSLEGYFSQITTAHLTENQELDLGTISLTHDAASESRLDAMMQMSEEQLENEAENSALSGTFSSRTDVYLSQTGYNFSPMRFRTRGYDNTYESTYINGVHFVDAERGGFNYSSLGGMNTATRNRDVVYGLTPNSFAYGNLGTNTNINARASVIAAGHNASVALTNRTYNVRAQYTYGTGILENGWAFAISGIVRWSVGNIPIVDGTFYNSGGLMLMAEKIINDKHSIALTLMGAPTRRAGQSAITKETRDLTSIYYNPSWGYQDGKVRNFRVYKTFDPTATFSHEWKISERQRLRTGIGFHYNFYSNAAMAYNGSHPSPDYYRYMPSFEVNDAGMRDMVTDLWLNDEDTRQMNWNLFYLKNKNNNNDSPDGQAAYAILRRHNNLMESILNSVYQNQINDNLKLTIGIEGKWAEGHHYQTVDDLMGANQMLDFDTYADRDMVGDNSGWSVAPLAQYIQNDVRYPNRIVHEGDIFGYNYAINSKSANAFAQIEYNWRRLYMYVAGKGTYNDFYRHGYMENGRAWYLKYLYDNPSHPDHDHGQDVKSLGKSKTWWFIEPSVKGGFMYNIDNRSRLSFNILAEMRAPLIKNVYVSERIKDALVPNIKAERILAMDLNYTFNYKPIRGRISAFRTIVLDAADKYGYYDDENRTFVNHLISGYSKLYQGVEAGVSVPVSRWLTVKAAGTYADYHYTSDAVGIKSAENGAFTEISPYNITPDKSVFEVNDIINKTTILTKGLKINNGPQLAANITASFFYKMWFIDVTLNYYDRSYLDFAPNRFIKANYGNLPAKFYSDENLRNLQEFCTVNGTFNEDIFRKYLTVSSESSPEKKAYWAQFGIDENNPINWGFYGDVVNKDATGLDNTVRGKLATQERLKGGFTLDLSVGKVIYFRNHTTLNFNLSVSNILNNQDLVTGGYQQARIPSYAVGMNTQLNKAGLDWYSNKYYYAWGMNCFLNIGYRF